MLQGTEPQAAASRMQAAPKLSLGVALGSLESFLKGLDTLSLGGPHFPVSNSKGSVFFLLHIPPQLQVQFGSFQRDSEEGHMSHQTDGGERVHVTQTDPKKDACHPRPLSVWF